MLIVVIVCFIVCILPDVVMSALYLGYTESDSFLVKGVREITDTLLVFNAAVNFLLYIIFNRKFQIGFQELFPCVTRRRGSGAATELDDEEGRCGGGRPSGTVPIEKQYRRLVETRTGPTAVKSWIVSDIELRHQETKL